MYSAQQCAWLSISNNTRKAFAIVFVIPHVCDEQNIRRTRSGRGCDGLVQHRPKSKMSRAEVCLLGLASGRAIAGAVIGRAQIRATLDDAARGEPRSEAKGDKVGPGGIDIRIG